MDEVPTTKRNADKAGDGTRKTAAGGAADVVSDEEDIEDEYEMEQDQMEE